MTGALLKQSTNLLYVFAKSMINRHQNAAQTSAGILIFWFQFQYIHVFRSAAGIFWKNVYSEFSNAAFPNTMINFSIVVSIPSSFTGIV